MKYRTTLLLDSQSQLKTLAELFNTIGISGKRCREISTSEGLRCLARACLSWTPQELETFRSLLHLPQEE
jgi:hypothetical protein